MLNLLKIIVSPLMPIYLSIISFRNWLFDKNIFKADKVNSKVISIGNITVGGSGKTPTVIKVSNILKSSGKRTGVLSRGYGRSTAGYKLVNNGTDTILPVKECGDEMFLVVNECNIPGAVAERRAEGAHKFLEDVPLDVIVLDDAFQHRWIHRDLDIVMFDQRFLLKNSLLHHRLLPLGIMREPFSSVERADIIIINRKFSEKKDLSEKLLERFRNKKNYYGYYDAIGIYDVKTHHFYSLEEFKGQKSLVVCGIARPYSFLNVLESNSIDIKNKLIFSDHKDYSLKEINDIRKKFYDTNSFSVLTTQKDSVKLTNYSKELDDIDVYYLKIDLKLEDEENFKKDLLEIFDK
ncbi:MAG: tetraacyldisaccharide 4'-kinase [Bacteroidetes bacterium]|nr:tetraacyldisaccharide 4'-kinase [Bacteroidota bacterium]